MLEEGQLTTASELEALIRDTFPKDSICHAFGYGSGVFEQQQQQQQEKDKEESKETKMIDLILVMKDDHSVDHNHNDTNSKSAAWNFHNTLLTTHPHHYSLPCRLGGPSFCAHLQNSSYGAKVSFHAFVEINGYMIKYGMVEKKHLLHDLNHWTYLYLAGRMHKPTMSLITDDEIMEAQTNINLPRALATSLVLLQQPQNEYPTTTTGATTTPTTIPATASLPHVFESIAQLSYSGDPRMDVGGEDPNKIHKLVHGNKGQLDRFQQLFQPSLEDFAKRGLLSWNNINNKSHNNNFNNNDNDHDATTITTATTILEWDPHGLQSELSSHNMKMMKIKNNGDLSSMLRDTVRSAARSQTLKGIVTAGLVKSTKYAMAKLAKGRLR